MVCLLPIVRVHHNFPIRELTIYLIQPYLSCLSYNFPTFLCPLFENNQKAEKFSEFCHCENPHIFGVYYLLEYFATFCFLIIKSPFNWFSWLFCYLIKNYFITQSPYVCFERFFSFLFKKIHIITILYL